MHSIALSAAALVTACLVLPCSSAAEAGPNASLDLRQQTPMSLFSYGMYQLSLDLQQSFASAKKPPFANFTAPLSGPIADDTTVIYDEKNGTITLNLVKIDDLPYGTRPDDDCAQAMAALRNFAGLDPTTGQLSAGMASSGLAFAFSPEGSPIKNAPSDDLTTLDQAFRLRDNFGIDRTGHFECLAPLFGTTHTLKKLSY
jgi:hypothetical protein